MCVNSHRPTSCQNLSQLCNRFRFCCYFSMFDAHKGQSTSKVCVFRSCISFLCCGWRFLLLFVCFSESILWQAHYAALEIPP